MVAKPGLVVSLLDMGVATVLGLLSTLALRGGARSQEVMRAHD